MAATRFIAKADQSNSLFATVYVLKKPIEIELMKGVGRLYTAFGMRASELETE